MGALSTPALVSWMHTTPPPRTRRVLQVRGKDGLCGGGEGGAEGEDMQELISGGIVNTCLGVMDAHDTSPADKKCAAGV
jgi:hypothetical protein